MFCGPCLVGIFLSPQSLPHATLASLIYAPLGGVGLRDCSLLFPFVRSVPSLHSGFRSQKAAPDGRCVPSNLLVWEPRGRAGSGESYRLEVTRQVGGLRVLASGCSQVSVPGVDVSPPPSLMGVLLSLSPLPSLQLAPPASWAKPLTVSATCNW